MKLVNLTCYAALLILGSTASGQDCKGLSALQAEGGVAATNPLQQLFKALMGDSKARADCGSLTSVLDSVVNTRKTGGRKLEEDRPFNPSEAQANLADAQSDPAVQQRLDQVRKEVPDSNQRLVYEAAILDEEGYYGARDLRIRQLQQQLK
ncbi:hypothetical protein [Pseudomonas sp. TCU-HL1]|uniref:hypothetical protein n=1 Tax=Pseudomonas sp. TCU-HL1 TaxID=1856685 RepID=UPI00083E06C0|nr:hypothetical protein [Pseudomonas sp. TCU-HL1]AOE84160.1 hypothetical protein THL1_1612 [Pseudomonas sp. TCU-HL1]